MHLRSRRSEITGSSSSIDSVKSRNRKLTEMPPPITSSRLHVGLTELPKKSNNTAVNTSQLETVVGREKEIDLLNSSILPWISERCNGSLYISGAPGTGKTATVTEIVQKLTGHGQCRSLFLNCMQITSPREIYTCIVEGMGGNGIPRHFSSQDKVVSYVESFLTKISQRLPLILVLDEIDQLASRCQDVLYRIFGWPDNLKEAHIVLIGIANALDLTERLLPGLRAHSLRPIHVAFPPYSKDQIIQIIKSRITSDSKENSSSAIDDAAIQFCARKVAASSGDVRTALAVCQRALELARLESCSKQPGVCTAVLEASPIVLRNLTPLQQRIMSSPSVRMSLRKKSFQVPSSKLSNVSEEDKQNVEEFVVPTIKHISQAIREAQSGGEAALRNTSSASGASSAMPLHHKLVLASLLLLRRQKYLREATLGQVFDVYSYVCSQRGHLAPLEMSEFVSVCDLLEVRGLVRLTAPGAKSAPLSTPARTKRMALLLDDRGVERNLDDNLLLSSILAIQSLP
ncbi:unnamed protein product [Hymenolepis diminuta]|uniref:Cell division control protein n=1 Tax=Hymenolepis diminuta TaxID=6216 RepID=A0A0R3SEA1_HYMDI|nr:unnamed protein product [Hymenolepis diminuta]VUZ45746.1 unnamed protein product [Hymenolepis diminuta]